MDTGGAADLTQGYKVEDIQNIVRSANSNGVPVLVKDVANVRRRLHAAARQGRPRPPGRHRRRHRHYEPHAAHQRRGGARQARDREDQYRRHPAAGRETRAVLRPHHAGRRHDQHGAAQSHLRLHADLSHSVAFSRRPAQRHHRRRQHSVRAVLQHHHPGDARRGCQPVVGRRRRFRHHRRCGRHPGREHLSAISRCGRSDRQRCSSISPKDVGATIRPTRSDGAAATWTDRLRLI